MPPLKTPAAKAAAWAMPRPPAIVLWTNAPGGTPSYAVVTAYGRHSVNLMIFPPDSRVGVPKDAVRYIDDPWCKVNGINADAGVWDYTDESRELEALKLSVAELVLAKIK